MRFGALSTTFSDVVESFLQTPDVSRHASHRLKIYVIFRASTWVWWISPKLTTVERIGDGLRFEVQCKKG